MFVVCFNGPPRSGKDTLARMLGEHMDSQQVAVSIVEASLSTPLRQIAYGMVGEVYAPNHIGALDYEKFKETHYPQFGCTGRQLMIDVSERFLKPCYGPTILPKMLLGTLGDFRGILLVRDSGFKMEVQTLAEAVGPENLYVAQVYRDGCDFSKDSRNWVGHCQIGMHLNNDTLNDLREEAGRIYERLVNRLNWKL